VFGYSCNLSKGEKRAGPIATNSINGRKVRERGIYESSGRWEFTYMKKKGLGPVQELTRVHQESEMKMKSRV